MTFFPQHFLGLNGIPRRYSDYPDVFIFWNIISSMGSILSLFAVFIFIYIIWEAFILKNLTFNKYFVCSSLEWLSDIPPMDHTFNQLNFINNN